MLSDAKSYAERLFDVRGVGPLEGDAQDQAIAEPAADLSVSFEPPALVALRELAGGYPFFIQTHAKIVWDAAVGSPIGAKGLVYAPERGVVAFTVPHMSPYLRSLPTHEFSDD